MKKPIQPKHHTVTEYWHAYYATEHCTLCGNSGVIDTTNAKTNAGVRVGRKNWCICPNGQEMRAAEYSIWHNKMSEPTNTEELEFRTTPVVSTAHITREDDELLSRAGTHGHIDGALRFGYMLRVSTDRGDWHGDMSEGFMGLMKFIHANGFEWVILDCDGSVISALPTYEW